MFTRPLDPNALAASRPADTLQDCNAGQRSMQGLLLLKERR